MKKKTLGRLSTDTTLPNFDFTYVQQLTDELI